MPSSLKRCPECGEPFEARSLKQVFCTPVHKTRFYNLQVKRGLVVMPLLEVWRSAQPRYPHGPSRELGSYAYREACSLLSRYVAEDRKAGRDPAQLVATKHELGWRAADLERAPQMTSDLRGRPLRRA